MDRRIFLSVSGAALTAPAWEYVDHLSNRGGSGANLPHLAALGAHCTGVDLAPSR